MELGVPKIWGPHALGSTPSGCARLPQLRGRASVQHPLSSHPMGPEIMSQRLFAPILHPGRALVHQGTAHPAVVSAEAQLSMTLAVWDLGRGRGAPDQLPPRIPLMKPLHGIFFPWGSAGIPAENQGFPRGPCAGAGRSHVWSHTSSMEGT